MEDLWSRIVVDLAGRLDGPLWFRLLMQPSIACVLALVRGLSNRVFRRRLGRVG